MKTKILLLAVAMAAVITQSEAKTFNLQDVYSDGTKLRYESSYYNQSYPDGPLIKYGEGNLVFSGEAVFDGKTYVTLCKPHTYYTDNTERIEL